MRSYEWPCESANCEFIIREFAVSQKFSFLQNKEPCRDRLSVWILNCAAGFRPEAEESISIALRSPDRLDQEGMGASAAMACTRLIKIAGNPTDRFAGEIFSRIQTPRHRHSPKYPPETSETNSRTLVIAGRAREERLLAYEGPNLVPAERPSVCDHFFPPFEDFLNLRVFVIAVKPARENLNLLTKTYWIPSDHSLILLS